jgi:type IV secretory pathway component VirB8
MKQEWEKVRKKIDDLERTDSLVWKKISTRELKMIQANLHRRDRKHWYEPALFELERRRYLRLIIIGVLTLIAAIIGIITNKF